MKKGCKNPFKNYIYSGFCNLKPGWWRAHSPEINALALNVLSGKTLKPVGECKDEVPGQAIGTAVDNAIGSHIPADIAILFEQVISF